MRKEERDPKSFRLPGTPKPKRTPKGVDGQEFVTQTAPGLLGVAPLPPNWGAHPQFLCWQGPRSKKTRGNKTDGGGE